MKLAHLLCIAIIMFSCNSSDKKLKAQDIIDKSIAVRCNGNCDNSTIVFSFRNINYKSIKKGGLYRYERLRKKGDTVIRDVLKNSGFERYVNDALIKYPDSISTKIGNSVNSVHYFVQLPYGLNAPAVKKELLGEATIKGKIYYEIGVSFAKEGGGTDHDDKFVYWVNKSSYALDYLAYSYTVNGGGIRFREAYNKRMVNGITFMDYNNYKPENLNIELSDLDDLFQKDKLQLISKIETENIEVVLGNEKK